MVSECADVAKVVREGMWNDVCRIADVGLRIVNNLRPWTLNLFPRKKHFSYIILLHNKNNIHLQRRL
jgi:hypothetical protein